MTTHHLKIESHWYQLLWAGIKTHEVRYADRDYQKGDLVSFRVGPDQNATYRTWVITHVLHHQTGVADGFVVLSLEHPDKAQRERDYKHCAELSERYRRSNAALRGQVTKLRKRIGGAA